MTTGGQSKELWGLVLAGGKSKRMGHDKGLMEWHGQQQRYYMAGLLQPLCAGVFLSCREDQVTEITQYYPALPDTVALAGPLAGILTAFAAKPQASWLVTACDLPLLDAATLAYLVQHRNPDSLATTYLSPFDGLPEPLITIWEPAALPILKTFMADGFSCPRKALIRNQERVTLLTSPDPNALLNANTPEDAEKVRAILAGRQNTGK